MRPVIAVMLLCSTLAAAQLSGTGIGAILGEPTGLSLKVWLSGREAVTAGAAWSFRDDGSLSLWADYTRHAHGFSDSADRMAFYYGLGGRLSLVEGHDGEGGETRFGVRIPLGLMLPLEDVPVDLFVELVPTLNLAPGTDLDLGGGVGAHLFL